MVTTLRVYSKLPFIVVHSDASILDVPAIYRWNGSCFVDDSPSHSGYYKELLAEDRRTLAAGASAPVLLDLSRIAMLAGDHADAQNILRDALARERSKGRDADHEILRRITEALRALNTSSQ